MSETSESSGSCLCGAVKVLAKTMSKNFGVCHCGMCQTWGGGPLLATDCGADVSFEGEDSMAIYQSSDYAERGFCKQCGTHMFYRLKERKLYHVPVGLFDLPEGVRFASQIFMEDKPDYYDFSNKTHNMSGEEVFAAEAAEAAAAEAAKM